MLRASLVSSRLILKPPRTLRVGESKCRLCHALKIAPPLDLKCGLQRQSAYLAGMSVSELVRRRALGKTIHAATDLMMIRELRRLGGLQKYAMNKLIQHSDVAEECVAAIRALRVAIERVANHDR
jgi:hypothetical protein